MLGFETLFVVVDTQKQGDFYLHHGVMKQGILQIHDSVDAQVNSERRQAIQLNHSATHLLHAALRELLGAQVVQKGSLVKDEYLRFDFSYPNALTHEEIKRVEEKINEQIRVNLLVQTQIMALQEAKKRGTIALFGEKYSEQVRVLSMGEFSSELCGGTHIRNTGEIGLFKIISETGIAAGIRRIEAVTGRYAIAWLQKLEAQLDEATKLLKTDHNNFKDKLSQIIDHNRQLEKTVEQLQQENMHFKLDEWLAQVKVIGGVNVLAFEIKNVDIKILRMVLDRLRQKFSSTEESRAVILVLASVILDKISLLCTVSKNYSSQINAGELLTYVAQQVGGKAGGRADMAQGGGNNPAALPGALQSVYSWVENKLCL